MWNTEPERKAKELKLKTVFVRGTVAHQHSTLRRLELRLSDKKNTLCRAK